DVSVVADACVAADRSAHAASLASMGLIAEVAPLAQLLATTLAGTA
ncbi:MAG: cysteine hydrolase, partial [Proteobacteria bacterium]|nr:cysteine hydrolase [Pseudomonadota bacterium]